jgi:hypothetical protein
MLFKPLRCYRRKSGAEQLMESRLFKAVAVSAIVYLGATAIHRIMD